MLNLLSDSMFHGYMQTFERAWSAMSYEMLSTVKNTLIPYVHTNKLLIVPYCQAFLSLLLL